MKTSSKIAKTKKLVIFGLGDFSEIAFEYFSLDSEYEVVAFTVTREYISEERKFGIPIIAFEELATALEPKSHDFFAAVLYTKMNDFRKEIAMEAKKIGFGLASYISTRSFVWDSSNIGEHCFIFEDNTIQPFVKIGFNNIFWSGNHIGHHSRIGDNCFISSHVVVSGACKIESNVFVGVNATISNNISIGTRTWISPGSLITKDVPGGSLVSFVPSQIRELNETLLERKLQEISKRSSSSQSGT
jgi:sugar O-acyltransferase (sialic acid O-acetyltransferase NeuD family)